MPTTNPLIEFFTEHYNFDVAWGRSRTTTSTWLTI